MPELIDSMVKALRQGARARALAALIAGEILLNEHEGNLGVWASGPAGRFFVELAVADRALPVKSNDPNDHMLVWAHGKNRRPVQLQIDSKSGTVINADEVLKELIGMDEEEQEEALREIERQVEAEEGVELAVSLPGDYIPLSALAENGGCVTLSTDPVTGHVRNWFDAKPFILTLSEDLVELGPSRYTRVKGYRKEDGTKVKGHFRRIPIGMEETPADARTAPAGSEFLGYAQHKSYAQPKARNVKIPETGERVKQEFPEKIEAPTHWAVWRHPSATKATDGAYGLYHPDTGEAAPEGVSSHYLHGEENPGGLRAGFSQGRKYAVLANDPHAEERMKTEECIALSESFPRLKRKIDSALSEEGMTRAKLCAAVVLLINRQQFRIGSKVGNSEVKSKGAAGETFGVTVLRPEHVQVSGNKVTFEFDGKSGKRWKRIDSDHRTAGIISELLESAEPGRQLFRYTDGEGREKPLRAEDVREFVSEFGFSPHNFRHYYASLIYLRTCHQMAESGQVQPGPNGGPEMHRAAIQAAADILNDEPATVEKNYVLASLQKQAKAGEVPENTYGLKRLELAEADDWAWFDIEGEDEFQNYLYDLWHQLSAESADLSESGAPPKALGPNERWITIKPHGPDHPDYRHVVIRQMKDGSAMIVWSGHKGLNHLRLNKVGTKEQIQVEQRKKPKLLTPEQAQAEKEQREARKAKLEESRQAFGENMVKHLGLDGVASSDQVLSAIESGLIRPTPEKKEPAPRDPAQEAIDAQKEKERLEQIAEGEISEGTKGVDEEDDIPETIARRMLADTLGEDPGMMGENVPPEIAEKWNALRDDPEHLRKLNLMLLGYKKEQSKIKREMKGEGGSIRVIGTLGYYAEDPASAEAELMKDHVEQFQKDQRSRFHGDVDSLDKAHRYYSQGMGDGLAHALGNFGGSGQVLDQNTVDLFSPQVVSEVIAHHIRSLGEGVRKKALDNLEKEFVEREFETVSEALAKADEFRAERAQIAQERLAGNILQSAASRALAEATIQEKKHLARAAGSLESMALVMDSLRQESPRPIHIKAGGSFDRIISNMEKAGMAEGQDFHLTNEGIQILPESAPKLLKTLGKVAKLSEERAMIKSHKANTDDFAVPGASQNFRGLGPVEKILKPEQQAAIRMFEHEGKVLGNLGVGLGKTIAFGAAHARKMQQLKAEGKPHHGVYFVPASLVQESLKGLREAFPDMDIQTVAGKDKAKRPEIYRNNHEMLLVSSDLVREDAETLAQLFSDPNHKPAAIYGDEVHALFSPNASEAPEDQSRRSEALKQLHADNMLVMTGTPFRQSLGEVHKVISWLHPDKEVNGKRVRGHNLGSMSSFLRAYGSLGQGTTAWEQTQYDSLHQLLDPYTITEKDPPKTAHNRHAEKIRPSEEQFAHVRAADLAYTQARAEGRHKERDGNGRDAQSRRMEQVTKIMAGGTHETNPLLGRTKELIHQYAKEGRTGIIHCTSLRAMKAAAASMPPGEVLMMHGGTSQLERERIKQAMNLKTPIEGGAVSVGGRRGVVKEIQRDFGGQKESVFNIGSPRTVSVEFDDGSVGSFKVEDVRSEVKAMAGTSVTSTGLNLQGTSYNIHLQSADSAAVREQRDARNYRTGQRRDVDSHYLIPDLPHGRKKARILNQQEKTMRGIDDPQAYEREDSPFMDDVLARYHHRKETEDDEGLARAA